MNNCSFWNIPGSTTMKQPNRQLGKKCNKRLKFQDGIQIYSVIMSFTPKPMALLLLTVFSAIPLYVLIFRDLLDTEIHSRQRENTRLKFGQRQRTLFTADKIHSWTKSALTMSEINGEVSMSSYKKKH